MRRFLIKFLIFFALFHATTAFYYFYVVSNSSGDIGRLGQIPFGKQYGTLDVSSYHRTGVEGACVKDVSVPDSLRSCSVLTCGDSFSVQGEWGYQFKLSALLGDTIANFPHGLSNPFQTAVRLINSGFIDSTQTLIVECVERSVVHRLTVMDTTLLWDPQPSSPSTDVKPAFLDRYLSWIRLSFDIDDPIHSFPLSRDCFENPLCHGTLYVYSGEYDGDFIYRNLSHDNYIYAARRARLFLDFTRSRGIRTFILIATDKYDAYEPFIATQHEANPTLAYFRGINGIYDPKPDLQRAISTGTPEIYRHNNTHWSVIGADLVAEQLAEYMNR